MATATARKSRVYTISLPPELAQRAEALAQRDSRTMSELFREAFRTYSAQQARTTLDELGEYGAGRNPKGYTYSPWDCGPPRTRPIHPASFALAARSRCGRLRGIARSWSGCPAAPAPRPSAQVPAAS